MSLDGKINALRQLTHVQQGVAFVQERYNWYKIQSPSDDKHDYWTHIVSEDLLSLPNTNMLTKLCGLLRDHLAPRPESILKCRATLAEISRDLRVLIQHLTPLLSLDAEVTSPMEFQGADMKSNDVVSSQGGGIGPVLVAEKASYGENAHAFPFFQDYVAKLEKHRQSRMQQVSIAQSPDPVSVRVIKHSGKIVAYHILEFCNRYSADIARIVRMGTSPIGAETGVHTALVADILDQTIKRYPFQKENDDRMLHETTLPRFE